MSYLLTVTKNLFKDILLIHLDNKDKRMIGCDREYRIENTILKNNIWKSNHNGDVIHNDYKNLIEKIKNYDNDNSALIFFEPAISVNYCNKRKRIDYRSKMSLDIESRFIIDDIFDEAKINRNSSSWLNYGELNQFLKLHNDNAYVLTERKRNNIYSGGFGKTIINRKNYSYKINIGSEYQLLPLYLGIPCGIHGFIFNGKYFLFNPIGHFTYIHKDQFINFGDQVILNSDELNVKPIIDNAKLIAQVLMLRDYKGFFSLDGVLSENQFYPLEINTRYSTGLHRTIKNKYGYEAFIKLIVALKLELFDFIESEIVSIKENQLLNVNSNCIIRFSAPLKHEKRIMFKEILSKDRKKCLKGQIIIHPSKYSNYSACSIDIDNIIYKKPSFIQKYKIFVNLLKIYR